MSIAIGVCYAPSLTAKLLPWLRADLASYMKPRGLFFDAPAHAPLAFLFKQPLVFYGDLLPAMGVVAGVGLALSLVAKAVARAVRPSLREEPFLAGWHRRPADYERIEHLEAENAELRRQVEALRREIGAAPGVGDGARN